MYGYSIDKSWTLFLDRDGVINVRLVDDYVKSPDEFTFTDGTLQALQLLSDLFGRIIIVTNQRGIARGLMTEDDLTSVHAAMTRDISRAGGRIDAIYHCPHDTSAACLCRKPAIGMALRAKEDFPEIDFSRSIMAGDSRSDMAFGENAGMKCVYVSPDGSLYEGCNHPSVTSLLDFTLNISGSLK
ncbi:MAG TPA: HAD family hydrolase [Spirochaetota bacterium]|nr:HAD family hydrolase [Spirochaetota bacterium]